MKEEILNLIRERGLLLEKDILELLDSFRDSGLAKEFLLNIERVSGEKFISLKLLNNNIEFMNSVVKKLPGEEKLLLEKTFVKLGISLEVRKESEIVREEGVEGREDGGEARGGLKYKVFYADTNPYKKLEVKDFVGHFRARYTSLQRILIGRQELQRDLVSINKISGERQSLSIIGIVTEKRVTKNKNLVIRFEDLTGEISGIVKVDDEDIFKKGSELQLDDVVGVRASGNRDMLFVHDIFYPDCFKLEKIRFEEEANVAFISDIHVGSDRFLRKSFERFIEWVNGEEEDAKKVKYIFIVGDNVDGVGIFPGQENLLDLRSMREQYGLLASFLHRVPKRITMFMCPGQHDASRVAEPQPLIDKKYGGDLYDIENLVLVTNPCVVKLIENKKGVDREFKVLMYHGASMHVFVDEIKELREMKAYERPGMIVKHLLKRRHLAPSHGVGASIVYTPNANKDPLVIDEVPDVLCTGEVHRLDIDNYNGVLIITGSCWQATTPFEEKVGHVPDPCKVPVLNLKSGKLKVYDFSDRGRAGADVMDRYMR